MDAAQRLMRPGALALGSSRESAVGETGANPSAGGELTTTCLFKICGVTESELRRLLAAVDLGRAAEVTISSQYPDMSLRLTLSGADAAQLSDVRGRILAALGSHVYAEGDKTLEEVIGPLLVDRGLTLALAESCTGGYISHRVTRVAGSSAYYYGGVVTYSNEAKMHFLGVRPATLETHGAVSRETALEMSRGLRARTGAGIAMSVTGIAGPGGGSMEKPVGTVWISIALDRYHEARRFQFGGERKSIIRGAAQQGLNWLRLCLL